jgi:RNA polymerase-binding protein DksA
MADKKDEAVRKTPFNEEELAHFKKLILERRRTAMDDVERMRMQLQDSREQAENDTAYSFHMADAGTDAMEREKLYLMIARQQKYIGYLDRALERIRDKTYGICKVTGNPISKDRLEAVPHTEISIEAKLKQKK